MRSGRARRRLFLALIVVAVAFVLSSASQGSSTRLHPHSAPSKVTLAPLTVRQRIVALVDSQVGYRSDPTQSYCNKFSAYWSAGAPGCPSGELSEEWCADFAAWAWQQAGVQLTYGYYSDEINSGAASFYEWGVATGHWHAATRGYVAAPGDVAVYGLVTGPNPTAAHVAVVIDDSAHQAGPDVVNGDGDRTGFSVVEVGRDQVVADAGNGGATLSGYVSPPIS